MRTETITDSKTVNPSSYDADMSLYDSIDSAHPVDYGYASNTSGTYAQIFMTKGSNAETFFYYNFALNIPEGAVINSITCLAKAMSTTTATSNLSYYNIRLYSSSTAKGNSVTLKNTVTTYNLGQTASDWTARELNNAKIRLYTKRKTSNVNTAYALRFYGAALTVNYTYNQTIYEVTSQSDVAGVSMYPSSADITAGGNQVFDIYGSLTNVIVEDNSVDVTSQLVPQTGGSVSATYTLSNVSEDHFIHFYIVANKIYVKVNGAWQEAADVKVKVNGTWQRVGKTYKNINDSWVEQSDKSAIFDPNALYLKG